MKKKYIKIIVIVFLALFYILYGRIFFEYKPSRLICVGQINLNHDVRPLIFTRGFRRFDRESLEKELDWLSEDDYFVLSQYEIDELVKAVNQYENYPTVILSKVNSKVFWTRRRAPHVGYLNLNDITGYGPVVKDDVIYVYVTKCDEIDPMPPEWEW